MNKIKKFELSQKAHERLYNKLGWWGSNLEAKRKNYHAAVFQEQEEKQRILTRKEKQKLFKLC